jgi:hypothetical protein
MDYSRLFPLVHDMSTYLSVVVVVVVALLY